MSKPIISKYQADENVTRLIALQVIIIVVLLLFNQSIYPAIFLAIDFALRAFTYQPSPLAFIGKHTASALKLPAKPIFAAPKKFSAAVGFFFSIAILLLLYFNSITAAYIVGAVLVFFAFLEAVFKICVGCYIYDLLIAPIVNKKNNKLFNK